MSETPHLVPQTKVEKSEIVEYVDGPDGPQKLIAWAIVGEGRPELPSPVDPDGGRLLHSSRQVTYGPGQTFQASGHSIFSVEPGSFSPEDEFGFVELTETF